MAVYKVSVSYPDGHIEEIDDSFETLDQATKFGQGILIQVENTERYHKSGVKKKQKPYFLVLESGTPSIQVFDSRKK